PLSHTRRRRRRPPGGHIRCLFRRTLPPTLLASARGYPRSPANRSHMTTLSFQPESVRTPREGRRRDLPAGHVLFSYPCRPRSTATMSTQPTVIILSRRPWAVSL